VFICHGSDSGNQPRLFGTRFETLQALTIIAEASTRVDTQDPTRADDTTRDLVGTVSKCLIFYSQ
jgi:hypothetical protein